MKILMIFLVTLSLTGCVAKPFTETVEAFLEFFTKSSKESEEVVNEIGAILTTKEALKITAKSYKYKNDTDEEEVKNIILKETEVCNANDLNQHENFNLKFVEASSPMSLRSNKKSEQELIESFHLKCSSIDFNYLGSGESQDDKHKLAYAQQTAAINVSGLFSVNHSSIHTFINKGTSWKYWDSVIVDLEVKSNYEKWWVNKSFEPEQCQESKINPTRFIQNSISTCKTKGIWSDSTKLVINCLSADESIKSYNFFTSEDACREEYK